MKKSLIAYCFLFLLKTAPAQSVFSNPITGSNPSASNPYTTGQFHHGSLAVSGIGRGTGISAASANDRYNANGWTTSATADLNDYFEWTLAPSAGFKLSLTEFTFTGQRSASGPQFFALRSSLDGYMADIGTAPATGATIHLGAVSFQQLTGSVSFRLYGWGAPAGSGTFSVNEFSFSGLVESISLPVHFADISLKQEGKTISLHWSNLTEESLVDYTIERAVNNKGFEIIARQPALFNDHRKAVYHFLDQQVPTGRLLYRIGAREMSGRMIYSSIVEINTHLYSIIKLYPNPAKERIHLETDQLPPGKLDIHLYSSAGKLLDRTNIYHKGGKFQYQIRVTHLPGGMYYLKMEVKMGRMGYWFMVSGL